jgi:hypothetical protein
MSFILPGISVHLSILGWRLLSDVETENGEEGFSENH